MASTATLPACFAGVPGPPPIASNQQPPKKVDPKKPGPPPSYLPHTDPGTTYSALSAAAGMSMTGDGGLRRKRARIDKGPLNRPQRVSSRMLSQMQPEPSQLAPWNSDSDPTALVSGDCHVLSRSTSAQRTDERPVNGTNGRSKRLAKGKGREREEAELENPFVKIKEEPMVAQIPACSPEPVVNELTNEDHCSACESVGALIYCDSCPRAFHLWCLDPPMDPSNLPEGDDRWYCPACANASATPVKIPYSLFSPLVQQVETSVPAEYKLPEDIRTFFRGTATGPRGAYVDTSNDRPPRIGRHGFGEDFDPHRLRDNKGGLILCFRCKLSSLPGGTSPSNSSLSGSRQPSTSSPDAQWKTLVSCDYCDLHWHLDCIYPPQTSLPPSGKKWKCPNHASTAMPKRRIPKSATVPIEVQHTHEFNNGNIEVLSSDTHFPVTDKSVADEVVINGRRYRVPERVIILDFWDKMDQSHSRGTISSIASSPLTSLSSLNDWDDSARRIGSAEDDTLEVARLLCSLGVSPSSTRSAPARVRICEKGTQTDFDLPNLRSPGRREVTSARIPITYGPEENRSGINIGQDRQPRRPKGDSSGSLPTTPRMPKAPSGRTNISVPQSSPQGHRETLNKAESRPVQPLIIRIPRLGSLHHNNPVSPPHPTVPAAPPRRSLRRQKSLSASSPSPLMNAPSPPRTRTQRTVAYEAL